MASNIGVAGAFSARPTYDLYLYVARLSVSGRTSMYSWSLTARWHSGSPRAYEGVSSSGSVNIGGITGGLSGVLDFRSTDAILLGAGQAGPFQHDPNGNLNMTVSAAWSSGNFGSASPSGIFYTDSIGPAGTVPDTPPAPVLSNVLPTSMQVDYRDAGNGGQPITSRALQVAQTPDFTGATDMIPVDSSGVYHATGLSPGYPFYWRYRTQNVNGVSAWSPYALAYTAAVRVDNGTAWEYWVVEADDGTKWVTQVVEIDDGTTWKVSS